MDRRTRLHRATLNDLLEIHVEGPSLQDFKPNSAVESWWSSCKTSRRPNQSSRKEYSSRNAGASTSSASISNVDDERCSSHIEWDSWFDENIDGDNLSSNESGSEASESDE